MAVADAPKLRSFIVVLGFAAPGPLTVGAWIAPDEASAAALAAISIVRQFEGDWQLQNCLVVEESAENLRHRLAAIARGERTGVVSLVPQEAPQPSEPGPAEYMREGLSNDPRAQAWATQSAWRPDDPPDPVA